MQGANLTPILYNCNIFLNKSEEYLFPSKFKQKNKKWKRTNVLSANGYGKKINYLVTQITEYVETLAVWQMFAFPSTLKFYNVKQQQGDHMKEHTVERLGMGIIEFEGGAATEIDPPPKLSVGDIVQVGIVGVLRQEVSCMKWTDKEGQDHFISYRHGMPVT